MVVNGGPPFNGSYHEESLESPVNVCTLSHISIPKSEKTGTPMAAPTTVSSSTDYCSYNIKSETVTPGLPGRSGTGYPIW